MPRWPAPVLEAEFAAAPMPVADDLLDTIVAVLPEWLRPVAVAEADADVVTVELVIWVELVDKYCWNVGKV